MTALEPLPMPATSQTRKPVLLIVDDEPGPRESLRIIFKDRYQCAIATCGREGIEYARQHPVDIAVLDIKMPDISGIEVLRELKEIDSDIECILLTAYETVETARAAVHFGAAEYLNKPFDIYAIRDVIEKCVARRRRKLTDTSNLRSLREAAVKLSHTDTANILSAGVVHELNNPLTIIAGYIQLLNRDLAKLNDGDVSATQNIQQRLAAVQREIQRSKEIAERFLRFSRSPNTQPEVMDLNNLVEDTALLLRAHPSCGEHRVVIHAAPASLPIRVASVEIMQLLINLGVNALQAMNEPGTVTLATGRAPQVPADSVFRAAGFDPHKLHVVVSVTDTGCGIAPENIQKVFVPYFTTKTTGNGIGLAVVGEIVSKYNGLIHVQSAVGKGSTFNVFLPLAA